MNDEDLRKLQEDIKKLDAAPPPSEKIPNWLKDTMTVADLIEELKKMPQDAPVITEGCDCNGEAASVVLCDEGKRDQHVYIQRGR